MAKKEETEQGQIVVIDGEEHNVADLSQDQVVLLNHVADLENKTRQTSFSLEQAQGALNFFRSNLMASLDKEEPKAEAKAEAKADASS